jgi:succinyl-CoA synthetase beta subunit
VIIALCRIIETSPMIDEIEINPLMLAPVGGGALALDAVIWNTAATPQEEETP